eukprot:Colp12_sorted_trinity150504_noHs@34270
MTEGFLARVLYPTVYASVAGFVCYPQSARYIFNRFRSHSGALLGSDPVVVAQVEFDNAKATLEDLGRNIVPRVKSQVQGLSSQTRRVCGEKLKIDSLECTTTEHEESSQQQTQRVHRAYLDKPLRESSIFHVSLDITAEACSTPDAKIVTAAEESNFIAKAPTTHRPLAPVEQIVFASYTNILEQLQEEIDNEGHDNTRSLPRNRVSTVAVHPPTPAVPKTSNDEHKEPVAHIAHPAHLEAAEPTYTDASTRVHSDDAVASKEVADEAVKKAPASDEPSSDASNGTIPVVEVVSEVVSTEVADHTLQSSATIVSEGTVNETANAAAENVEVQEAQPVEAESTSPQPDIIFVAESKTFTPLEGDAGQSDPKDSSMYSSRRR